MARRPTPKAAKQATARLVTPTARPAAKSDRVRSALDTIDGIDRLDISRPFGKVTGDYVVNGVRVAYEQGQGKGKPSKLYDHAHRRIYREGERPSPNTAPVGNQTRKEAPQRQAQREAIEEREEKPVRLEVDAAGEPHLMADLDNDDVEEDLPPMEVADLVEPVEGDDRDVNLTAWGERKVTYRWAAVRDAIEARYGRVVNDEAEARDFLAEEGIGKGSGRKAKLHAKE